MNILHKGVVVILENTHRQIALQLRDDAPYDEMWGLFGGWLEQTETPEQAIVREIEEELGFTVDASRLSFLTTHFDESAESHIFHYLVTDELNHAVLYGRQGVSIHDKGRGPRP
jgi:8-oxo-dGTP diphosphatase